MSPTRLSYIEVLNYAIQQHDTNKFRILVQSGSIPYRVAIFKAIECGSNTLFNIVKGYHPDPNPDIELECLHASFRGQLNIYENIYYNEEYEEFNPYIENMYLFHGRFDKLNLIELNIHDLLSPNLVPISVCDYLVENVSNNSCLMTGVLLAYCIYNSDHYKKLSNNEDMYIIELMLKYVTQHDNTELKVFLLNHLKRTRKYTTIEFTNGRKTRKYTTQDVTMYDHYLTKLPADINYGKPLKIKGYLDHTIDDMNICLTVDMFEWPSKDLNDVDGYFDQVITQVNDAVDKEWIKL
jgi:hypothetical protein